MKKLLSLIFLVGILFIVGCNSNVDKQLEDQQEVSKDELQDSDGESEIVEPDCCSQEQKNAGFKCMRDCGPPALRIGDDPIVSHSCLSPDDIENRERYGCPI